MGLITTVPAEALTGSLNAGMLVVNLGFVVVMLVIGSLLFRKGLRSYASTLS